jgi:hypothetical protein
LKSFMLYEGVDAGTSLILTVTELAPLPSRTVAAIDVEISVPISVVVTKLSSPH